MSKLFWDDERRFVRPPLPAEIGRPEMIGYRMKNGAKAVLRRPWRFFRNLPSRLELLGARILTKTLPQLFSIERNRLYPPEDISFAEDWVANDKTGLSEIRHVDPACTI